MQLRNVDWRSDITSGFIVFLVALPLSLGIAMASGVPPFAGLLAAIVGGMIVSRISGSNVTINGPAAGLIVVVLHGIETLGRGDPMTGYRGMLAVTVVSGLILFVAGRLKAGRLADLFPGSVVHGMLAAIGVIIIAKQVHSAVGVVPTSKETLGLLAEIPASLMNLNPEIAIIGAVSLVILLLLPRIPHKIVQKIPAPMVVVLVGIALGRYFDLEHQHTYLFKEGHEYLIGPKFLVSLPERFISGVTFPLFEMVKTSAFWGVVLSLTLIQGLETLLSATAVDRFDPLRRQSDLNKDLAAVGLGSAISGALGGLPIIAEIVRSRANVSAGAKSSWSNFFHGTFMLAFLVLVPGLIHQIPLACLAAILMVTGYRLASPSQFKHTLHIGLDQLVIFSVTLATTLATDLLIGVLTGIALKVVLHIVRGAPLATFFKPDFSWEESADQLVVRFRRGVIFTNFLPVKARLDRIPPGRSVIIDVSEAQFIDHTAVEKLQHFVSEYTRVGGKAEIRGLDRLRATTPHPLASRRRSTEKQAIG